MPASWNGLPREDAELRAEGENTGTRAAEFAAAVDAASQKVSAGENEFAELTAKVAQERTRKSQFEKTLRELQERGRKITLQLEQIERELADVLARIAALDGTAARREHVELLEKRAEDIEADTLATEKALEAARLSSRTCASRWRTPRAS